MYQVEGLRNKQFDDIYATRLKFYREGVRTRPRSYLTSYSRNLACLLLGLSGLEDSPDGLQIDVRWKGLEHFTDTLQPLYRVYEGSS